MMLSIPNTSRTALSRLEMESEREREHLQMNIKSLTEKLQAYEALEVEVDRAVLRVAAKKHTSDLAHSHPDAIVADIRGIPSHPESRIRQAVFLAQRLLQTEKERDEVLKKLETVESSLLAEQQAKALAEDRLRLAAKPAVYLVNKLREEECLRVQLADRVTVLTKDVQHWQRAWRKNETEIEQLRERLTLVLRQRGELETIKVMLHHLHFMEEQGSDDDESSDSEEESREDDLTKKLLPWKPSGGDGEIEFELSSTMEPERHLSVATQLGLPEDTIQQLITNHQQRQQQLQQPTNSRNSGNSNQNSRSNHGKVSAGIAMTSTRTNSHEEDEEYYEDDEDPEMIPLGYVRPDEH